MLDPDDIAADLLEKLGLDQTAAARLAPIAVASEFVVEGPKNIVAVQEVACTCEFAASLRPKQITAAAWPL